MSDIVPMIEGEIAQIESELAADPRHQKLRHLKELLALYRVPPSNQAQDVSTAAGAAAPRQLQHYIPKSGMSAPGTRRMDPERLKVLEAAEQILEGVTEPMKTSEIYEVLRTFEITVGGKEPKSNLSAMMFNSGRFQSHGRAGWTSKRVLDPSAGEQTLAFGVLDLSPPAPDQPRSDGGADRSVS